MSVFVPKSHPQIVGTMAAKVSAETPISDFSDGSVILTILEAAAQEDFQQYIQMSNIIRNYNLDTTDGGDLDRRAADIGLTRLSARSHSGYVTISDSRFTKISTKLYAGFPGPTAGTTVLFVENASTFPSSGSVYIGRGTVNSEGPIVYSTAPVDNTSYWTITLDVALTHDHGTDETIILSQFGNRAVSAGTEVEIPESDVNDRVSFEVNQLAILLDGEDSIENILVTALEPGGFRVTANSIKQFPNTPFPGAEVTNPLPFVNGRDAETDQQLRDRIRTTIQSLSRGTPVAVKNSILGLIDTTSNSSIVSASVVPPAVLADGPTKVYIDNGRGLEPSLAAVGLESVIDRATGGEKFFQLLQFPIAKANVISQNIELFSLFGTETLIVRVGTSEETFTFLPSDFDIPGKAKATEIAEAINNRATIFEARTITENDGRRVILTPVASTNENLQVDSNSTSQTALNFVTREVATLKLYKNDKILIKDGLTAAVLSLAQPFNLSGSVETTTDGDITITSGSRIVTKLVAGTFPFRQFISPGDYVRLSSDADLFYSRVRTVVSDIKLILDAVYPPSGGGTGDLTIWNSPQLEVAANGDQEQTEVVSFGPNDFATPTQALASEVFARVQKELNLSISELAVNNTKIKILSAIQNSANSKIQITGGYASLAMGFTTSDAIAGTLTFSAASKTVTGSGTAFLTDLQEDQWIKADLDGNGSWTKIETIESDTVLYLTETYRGEDRSGVTSSKINFGEVISGANKDYTLNRSNGQIELESPLLANDSVSAGSVNTRAFVDSLSETYNFSSLGSSSTLIIRIDGGFPGTVSTGDSSPPYSDFIDSTIIKYGTNFFVGFHLEWITGNNIGETSYIATYNTSTGHFTTTTGFTNPIVIGDKFVLSQVKTFTHVTDFADPSNATSQEVVNAINASLLGGVAIKIDTLNKVRIRTNNFEAEGAIKILGGSANQVLQFTEVEQTNQLTNLAFLKSGNSDRQGNSSALGYTLGPGQRLIIILDSDSVNKTVSVPLQVLGTSATTGTNIFTDPSLGTTYPTDNYFKDFWVYWTSGAASGSVQIVTSYVAATGTFNTSDIFPTSVPARSPGDNFALVPRTAENVVALMNDLNTTTLSINANIETLNITGDFVQISTKTAGSAGRVFVTGGSANSLGIAIQSIVAGAPVNDLTTNSVTGLYKGLLIYLTLDGKVTTGDSSPPYDTFIDTSLISAFPSYFNGQKIEFLTGANAGFITTVASYNNVTGQIVLTSGTVSPIAIGDTFRISQEAFVKNISGTSAPFTLQFVDATNTAIDVSVYLPERSAAIRDRNGLNFSTIQVEGIDGYKYFTNLIQKAQFTIDGLDRDPTNYPGIGAAGTQFEVLPPVLVKLKLIVNVTPNAGVSLSSISNLVSSAILEYVNSQGVGDDIVLSEIIAAAQSVAGVYDVAITNLTSNVVIADGELARLAESDLLIG